MRLNSRCISLCVCMCLFSTASLAAAQQQAAPELPQPSPKARIEQRVGLTDFSVDYSSPGVKGRKIWGELVAYDKPWRTGANAATKLTASRDFTFGGKPVPAGSYALYTVPGKTAWQVALNTSTDAWGNDGFDVKKDVVRVSVTPQAIKGRERLTFLFSDTSDDAVRVELEWEKLRVSIPITVATKQQVLTGIDKAVDDAWRPHFVSARYLLDNNGDLTKALGYIDQSIAIKPTWWNNWVRAQILAKQNRAQEAVATAEKALQLGTGDRMFESFFKEEVTKTVAGWKKKG
ncbi:MAG TPA: DUF2911 domain-containing protein [Polyangiales bacterium]|jgi:hypothetical protein|nr:DUF2911 domain-containing protein [Polyangiales bacterium]